LKRNVVTEVFTLAVKISVLSPSIVRYRQIRAEEGKMSEEIVRKKLIFKGEVQFVGFRFQSKYIADTLGLTGYVENLSNGDVLMEVQGRMATIQDMIICLHQKKPIRIDSIEEEDLPVKKKEKGFRYMW